MMMHFDFRSRPKSSRGLDPELRQIIDEALAAGRVTVIPQGVSGLPGYRWSEKENKVVCDDGRTQAERARDARKAYIEKHGSLTALNVQRADRAKRRREEVLAMASGGKSAEQIATERGESLTNVKRIIIAAKRAGAIK